LCSMDSTSAIAGKVESILGEPKRHEALQALARQTMEERFDLKRICLPRQIALVESMLHKADKGAR